MIIIYDEFETKFDSLGLGVLKDATNCQVKEELNGEFTLEMSYDISGANYNLINLNKIILAPPNPYDEPQPFRIVSISKPIKGIVTINANHISYDTNDIPVKSFEAETLADVFDTIKNGVLDEESGERTAVTLIDNSFTFKTDMTSSTTFKISQPYNLRAILMGDEEESLIGVYKAELKFDKFNINLLSKRGKNRGAEVRYGQNMTDLTHEITNDKLYNGVFPYYHTEKTSTETSTEETFKQVYIVGTKPFAESWLSYTENGEAYHPVDTSPVQIATEGDYYEKVYCWNTTYQKFEEKIYNESVTLIENVVSPGWIKIVWTGFPNVKCVANAKGYFKTASDTDWGEEKGVGDVIFEGNILTEGISGMATNMIIYYSQVIPSTKNSTTEEVSEVVEVMLDDPIIWLNTVDAKSMSHNRILMLDLTDEFDDEPTQQQLETAANNYISENKIGNMYTNTTVSFIDLLKDTNEEKYKNFSHIELGDTVRVIHNDMGINTELRVISTDYNVLSEQYNSVELGIKSNSLSKQSIENGDSISSLSNDAGYADVTTVTKLIAQTVSAEYINAQNATLSKAQIEELEVSKIKMPGVIEASQYVIDDLVAKMLTADNAKIANTLEAGKIKVNGKITVNGGSIDITGLDNDTEVYFKVDKKGNVEANSVKINGGQLTIGDDFSVSQDGTLKANHGVFKSAEIEGTLISANTINGANSTSADTDIDTSNGTLDMKYPYFRVVGGSMYMFILNKFMYNGIWWCLCACSTTLPNITYDSHGVAMGWSNFHIGGTNRGTFFLEIYSYEYLISSCEVYSAE